MKIPASECKVGDYVTSYYPTTGEMSSIALIVKGNKAVVVRSLGGNRAIGYVYDDTYGFYKIENPFGNPIFVHRKLSFKDLKEGDRFTIGSSKIYRKIKPIQTWTSSTGSWNTFYCVEEGEIDRLMILTNNTEVELV